MLAIGTVLAALLLSLLITRIATIALSVTGLSRETARFQARSAFTGVGFTTDLLGQMALERMVAGLSTRNNGAGLEPVSDVDQTGTRRSSVSRRFVERTESALRS